MDLGETWHSVWPTREGKTHYYLDKIEANSKYGREDKPVPLTAYRCGNCGYMTWERQEVLNVLQDRLGYRTDLCNECVKLLEQRKGLYKPVDLVKLVSKTRSTE
jgi:hypothetical protein